MAQSDILENRLINQVPPASVLTQSTSYFDGRLALFDDNNYLLYDVNGESSGGKLVGVVLRLSYKDPISNQRIYTGIYNNTLYTMTVNTSAVHRCTFTVDTIPLTPSA